jgi:hypothetical protein
MKELPMGTGYTKKAKRGQRKVPDDNLASVLKDFAALELALKQTLAEQGRVEQVQSMLQERDRMEVAQFCAYHRQCETLHLGATQTPPCWIGDPDAVLAGNYAGWGDADSERPAARLLKQMLNLGISKYHPDPLAAIKAAARKA